MHTLIKKHTVLIALFLNCSSVSASLKYYEADASEASWRYEGTPLQCRLSHKIPFYGTATFSKGAGIKSTLLFQLSYKRHALPKKRTAKVRAIAPAWQPVQTNKELGEVQLKRGKYLISSQNIASWRLLNELESGRFPTFSYQNFNQAEEQVSVAISAVGFTPVYDQFLDCLATLIPYRLEQLSKMTLFFDFDKDSVRQIYKSKISALATYIKHDPDIEVVFIKGHTDSKGSRYYNQKLSEQRINSVKKALMLDGVEEQRFKLKAYGEKKPAASNRNARGRAKNRRVTIQIAQN